MTLVHPRYWLQGPSDFAQDWQPSYPEDTESSDNDDYEVEAQIQQKSYSTSLQHLYNISTTDFRGEAAVECRDATPP